MSGTLRLDQKQLKRLTSKSDRQMAKEQHPESADVIIKMLNTIEKQGKRIVKLEKLVKGQENRIQKLVAGVLPFRRGR